MSKPSWAMPRKKKTKNRSSPIPGGGGAVGMEPAVPPPFFHALDQGGVVSVLTITVEGKHSDLDFARVRLVAAVEELAAELTEEHDFEQELEVGWDFE